MRRTSLLKQFAPVLAVAAIFVVIVVAWWASRPGQATPAALSEEQAQKVALATKLLEQGDPVRALRLFEELETEAGTRGLDEATALLKLQALDKAGHQAVLAREARTFLERFPTSKSAIEAQVYHLGAEVATAGLSNPLLLRSVEEFVAQNPTHPGVGRLTLALARHELAIGDRTAAQRRLQTAMASNTSDPAITNALRREMGDLNLQALLRGNFPAVKEVTYTVKGGDSIWVLARRHNLTPELLMKVNGIDDPARLRVGQTLRIPEVTFSLVCDVSTNQLHLYANNEFLKTYPVRTGRVAGTTPVGDFKILNKKTGPTWRPGDGRTYLPGDPNNELGTRWMAFDGDILGIHGTIHPDTVGHYASNGCIGMKTADVEELFDLVGIGTSLKIMGKQDLTQAKVIPARDIPPPLSAREIASRR
jgi:LysM repeat protein